MDFEQWNASLGDEQPPAQLPASAQALWWEARGDWERAHTLAQEVSGKEGAWVHAYLHRREGDTANARYWYRQAGKPVCAGPLDVEREAIVAELLTRASR